MGNLPSKFEHAWPLGFGIIHYVDDGQTDRWTDRSNAYCPLPYSLGYNKSSEISFDAGKYERVHFDGSSNVDVHNVGRV